MFRRSFKYLFSIYIILTPVIFSQWNFNVSTGQDYSTNPFRSQLATETLISSIDFGIEHSTELFNIGYSGSYNNFNTAPDRNFYWHQASGSMNYENSSLGILAEQRFGKDIYTYFNYTNITGYYSENLRLGDFYIRAAPNVSLSKYDEISILDNIKFSLNGSINRGFETGTTIILGGAFTFKKYLDPTQRGTYTYLDETNQLITANYVDKNVSSITQMTSFLRAAQSITESTGFAFQYTNRSIFSGFGNFVKDLNLIYGDESEIFDDPVNYEGNNLLFELTQIAFDDLAIKGGFYLNKKLYPSQGIYDTEYNYITGIMRSDLQQIFNLSVSKNFTLGSSETMNLSVGLYFQMIDNNSNSSLFKYKSNTIGLNIGLDF